ncbi:MAG: alpha/beta fold hydrolase [Anaerolineae bacterium]|nr:alpha/beta fold hydrolase [Anaerolineae bacterium]
MTAKIRIAISGLVLALLVLALAGSVQVQATAAGDVPRFEPAPCPVPAPDGVRCGYLVVWEDRDDPGEGTIRLAVAILPAESPAPAPDPVVYLEGGPGGSALEGLDTWLTSPLRAERDLILFEQRGTRYAEPELDCPELKEVYVETWVAGLDDDEVAAAEVAAAARCRERLAAGGIDLAAYNSVASAADLDELRRMLGYQTWNLYGISYGTRLALTVLREVPTGIRSVILDSVYPPQVDGLAQITPNTERVVTKLLADCQADAACRTAFPDLEAAFYDVWARANERPFEVRVPHPDTGEMLVLPVDGDDLVGVLFLAFYDADLIPYLPLVIDQLASGDEEVLAPLTHFTLSTYLRGSEGMSFSVTCHEEAPFNTPEEIRAAAQGVPPPMRAFELTSTLEICDLWGAGIPDPIEAEPVYSDVPVLILEGDYDPITPPAYGRSTAETLPNSYYFEFPGLGHGVTLADCPAEIARSFLTDPTSRPLAACLPLMGPPDFVTARDLYLTSASYRILIAFDSGASRLLVPLLAFVGGLVLILGYVALRALLRLFRIWPGSVPPGDGWFHGLLGLAASLNLVFLAGLAAALLGAMFGDWSILIFGLPSWAIAVLAIPVISGLITLILALLLAVAWRRRYGPAAWRVAYTLVWVGLAAFYPFLAYWDLLLGF